MEGRKVALRPYIINTTGYKERVNTNNQRVHTYHADLVMEFSRIRKNHIKIIFWSKRNKLIGKETIGVTKNSDLKRNTSTANKA